jgi:threonine dehydratase
MIEMLIASEIMRALISMPDAMPARELGTDAVVVFVTGVFVILSISIPRPHTDSLRRVREVVDEIVVVSDDQLLEAMSLAARHLSVVLEPAGAAGLAAIAAGLVPGERVAAVVTGANPSPTAVGALVDRLTRRTAA